MNLTNTERLMLLINDFIKHPVYMPRYLNDNIVAKIFGKQTALDLEMPWLSYSVIDFLKSFLKTNMKTFEWGSGGSTIFFSRCCRSVFSVEDDETWYRAVRKKLNKSSINNVRPDLARFDVSQPSLFADSDYVNSIGEEMFDVILVDAKERSFNERYVCFYRAERNISKGGIIIVDDSWRYAMLRKSNHAKMVKIFTSVGPARFGVTSTDVYFY